MPVNVSKNIPAIGFLEKENIFVITAERAEKQEIRPLKIAVLNLMPNKVTTETQLLRLIANSPLQVETVFVRTSSYRSKNTAAEHLDYFYEPFDKVAASGKKFDGLIITGAPVEKLNFTDVAYWDELKKIMDWSQHNVYSSMYICWAAQAAMFYYYGIDKIMLKRKISGVFKNRRLNRHNPIVRGFDDVFAAPQSRYTEVDGGKVYACPDVEVLAASDEAGLYLASSKDLRRVFVFGHGEYDRETLHEEYMRDVQKGLKTAKPKHYYTNGEVGALPPLSWRSHASLLFANWLNYCVYQATPYDLESLDSLTGDDIEYMI
jgi:homoserine O-succinyltransferase